jgi:SAM-dependent methyltransferase
MPELQLSRLRQEVGKVACELELYEQFIEKLRCPICKCRLQRADSSFTCESASCGATFPIIDGVPTLINESNSILSLDMYESRTAIYFKQGEFKHRVARKLPKIDHNLKARENYGEFARYLSKRNHQPKVLVIGGGVLGQGMESITSTELLFINSDIALVPGIQIIVDAHDIPFEDETFDGIIAQAVLEHVADPYRCVAEMRRVLKEEGLVYAEAAFMQQVHGGGVDFTRFTHLGLRRLFRGFHEISSGACCGPGMALAWSLQHFLLSFTTNRILRIFFKGMSSLFLFPLKYFDYLLIDKPSALDAASALYFMGKKSDRILQDRELVKQYRGAA